MIDFALSNCRHSGLDAIGVVTQYRPEALHHHIGPGYAWLAKPEEGEVALLSSRQAHVAEAGYTGTADAIYRNWHFIEKYRPAAVLVLSGDHIYRMDYRKLLEHHLASGADATIAVTPVNIAEASRFGIMKTDADGRITEFAEKPKAPASNLASMGIYIFDTSCLLRYLQQDASQAASNHDFGQNVIPAMLAGNAKLHAYEFAGYWKDVGTIDSLWEAHMDMLGNEPRFSFFNSEWPLLSPEGMAGVKYIEAASGVRRSIIGEDCALNGLVERSVVSSGVTLGQGSRIYDSIVMPGAKIGEGASVYRAIIGEGAVVRDGYTVGSPHAESVTVVGDREVLGMKGEKMPKIFIPAKQLQAELIG